jgi:hypothetical protein
VEPNEDTTQLRLSASVTMRGMARLCLACADALQHKTAVEYAAALEVLKDYAGETGPFLDALVPILAAEEMSDLSLRELGEQMQVVLDRRTEEANEWMRAQKDKHPTLQVSTRAEFFGETDELRATIDALKDLHQRRFDVD